MARCEDAPCCGCCGTNLYGVNQEAEDSTAYYCDACGYAHAGDCRWDDDELDPDDEDAVGVGGPLPGESPDPYWFMD